MDILTRNFFTSHRKGTGLIFDRVSYLELYYHIILREIDCHFKQYTGLEKSDDGGVRGYGDDGLDGLDATATNATAEGHEHEALSQTEQTMRQLEVESERNRLGNPGVLKAISGNAAKRLKMRQETRVTTRSGKTVEAPVKQIATQELQVDKARMEEWEQNVMLEVAHEL